MTNEEKAREIAEYYTDTNDIGVALNSAKEMADLKDQQFIECLERLQERFVEYEKHSDWEAIQEIINKFKKK